MNPSTPIIIIVTIIVTKIISIGWGIKMQVIIKTATKAIPTENRVWSKMRTYCSKATNDGANAKQFIVAAPAKSRDLSIIFPSA
jgi:hypothetical protein